jgi:hypothetical protein
MELRYEPAVFNDKTIPGVLDLLAVCFPNARKFTPQYLQWLYCENPDGMALGYHLFSEDRLVGQLIGVPERVILRGSSQKVLLLLDVAVHPDFRGGGLFLKMTQKTAELAAASGFAAVTGVANHNTYRGYPKIGFQDVVGLDARISLFGSMRLDVDAALERAEMYRDWSEEALAWRLRNPYNPLRIDTTGDKSFVVEATASYRGLRVRGLIPRRTVGVRPSRTHLSARPCLILNLAPAGTMSLPFSISIPDCFKPSPLRMIYLDLIDQSSKLNPDRILFNFLDFDIV